jgi:nitrogen PTS system EIIA component
MMRLHDLVDEGAVLFLETESRDEAIRQLVDALVAKKRLKHEEEFYAAVLARESLITTGIGNGVAIPHAKIPQLSRFFVAIGIDKRGIDWHALDGTPVRLIFLIGGPDDRHSEYLQLLSLITQLVKDETKRKKLLQAENRDEVIKLF